MPYDKFKMVRHSVICPHFPELVIIYTQAQTESLIKNSCLYIIHCMFIEIQN